MLRFVVLLLLLANGLYFAWARGLLEPVGLAPLAQSEPGRTATQIKPEAMRLLNTSEVRRIETVSAAAAPATPAPPAPPPPECLQTTLLDDRKLLAARVAAKALPSGSWQIEPALLPARWIIYMGKYPNADTLAKKKTELRQLGVEFEALQNKTLELGISLGNYDSRVRAEQEMADLGQRGVHTSKVLQEKPEVKGQALRLPVVDEALRAQLAPLRVALGTAVLRTCTN